METKYRHYITVALVPLFVAALLLAGCGKAIKGNTSGESELDGTDNTAPITAASPEGMDGNTLSEDYVVGSVDVTLNCVDYGGGGAGGGGGGAGGYGPVLSKSHPSGCAKTYYSISTIEDGATIGPGDPTITYDGPITISGGKPGELTEIALKFFSIDEAGNREAYRDVLYKFDSAPTIDSTTPDTGDADVPAGSVITAEFSEDMDADTITMDSFLLYDNTTNGDVAGGVSYDDSSATATFTPNSALVANRSYTATITSVVTVVTDAAGNPMAEDYSWTFATSASGGGVVETTYTVGGSVTGLTGTGLVLQNNGGNDLTVSANATSFTFTTAIADGSVYAVTVSVDPTGQICSVTNASGTISANVIDVAVTCIDIGSGFTVGGDVSGLTGTGLVLQNNGGDDLAIDANGAFNFSEQADSAGYDVTVSTDPTGQACTVTNGSGTISGADVTDVAVACVGAVADGFDDPPTQTASADNYSDNTFGLITAGTLQGWKSDWATSKAALGLTGNLIILQVGTGNYVGGADSGVDCSNVSSYDAPYNTVAPYEETRNNGLFDTVSMVADGASADVYLKMFAIDPVNDMVVLAMNSYNSNNFFLHGRIYYMLRYWGMAAENLALLNGDVTSNSGVLDTASSAPCTNHPNNGTWDVQGLPDNTGLQAGTGEMLAVARGDYTPSNGAFLWDVRTEGEYFGTPTSTFTKDAGGTYVAFEGTIRVVAPGNSGGWLEWSSLISSTTGAFNSKSTIEGQLNSIGYDGSATIYTWCRTAYRAVASLIAGGVIMGYPTKLYDASSIEWGELSSSDGGGLSDALYSANSSAATDSLSGPNGTTSSAYPTGQVSNPVTASKIIIDDKAYKSITWTSGIPVPGGLNNEEY